MMINHPGLISGVSKRPYNMSFIHGDTGETEASRKKFLGDLGINYRDLVCVKQIHQSNIFLASSADKGKGALRSHAPVLKSDALVTKTRQLPLAIFTADCLSIFLYDPQKHVAGLVHAGWRGTKERITIKTVDFMKKKFNTNPNKMHAGFGPAIGECCYEVGEEFNRYFNYGIEKRNRKYYFNLVDVNKKQLLDCGLDNCNIYDDSQCTACNADQYFSYRKDGDSCGRMMSVIMLK